MAYKANNILVTGGCGFIGSNFINYLFKYYKHINVFNLDKLSYAGSEDNIQNLSSLGCYKFIKGDVCDSELVDKVFQDYAIDTIIHFAAESHVDRSIQSPSDFIQSNIVGTYVLLEAARKFWLEERGYSDENCRFHHISSDEVYGSLKSSSGPFTEKSRYAPNSPYSASKAASDHLVRAYFKTYGLPVTTSNCSNNFGPNQHSEKFIPTIIRCCLAGSAIPIYGDGSNIRDWLYVEDHCHAIDLVLREGRLGDVYNIGGDNELSNKQLVNIVCEILDQKKPTSNSYFSLVSYVTDRLGHDWRYAIDSSKMKDELGWSANTTFEQGINKTVDWYLSHKDRLTIS